MSTFYLHILYLSLPRDMIILSKFDKIGTPVTVFG